MTNAKASAEELVFDLGLELPVIPSEVCRALSTDSYPIRYQEQPMSTDQFCGISIGNDHGAEILVNSNISTPGRRNFTGAHEIGHVVLHIQQGKQSEFQCTTDDVYGSRGKNIAFEQQANQFASSLLMPKSLIRKHILKDDISWQLIRQLSKICNASLEATARRVVEISSDMCVFIVHKKGQMWAPITSPSMSTFIDRIPFPKNLNTTPDNDDDMLPDYLEECDAIDWITNPKNLPESIYYSSIRNIEYDRTMTLLVIPEDSDDEEDEWEEPHF